MIQAPHQTDGCKLIKHEEQHVHCSSLTRLPIIPTSKLIRRYGEIILRSFPRGGILPYVYENGTYYFLLGQDENGELTDFAGGPSKSDKNILQTAIREYRQESGNCAGTMDDLNYDMPETYFLQMNAYFLILVPAKYSREECLTRFKEYSPRKPEIHAVYWISESELRQIIQRQHFQFEIYLPTRVLLARGLDKWKALLSN